MTMTRAVEPLSERKMRIQEQGRLRCGIKGPKGEPRGIDTWRATSPDEKVIHEVAAVYGGTVEPWHDERAKVKDQFQVITDASEVLVWVVPDAYSNYYELWSGGGCERRCDAVTCSIEKQTDDGVERVDVPCICNTPRHKPGSRKRDELVVWQECKPKIRMTVIIPEVRFGGGWRVESSSEAAMNEMPSMMRLLTMMQANGLVAGKLVVWKDMAKKGGKTMRNVRPRLILDESPSALMAGEGSVLELTRSGLSTPPAELESGAVVAEPEVVEDPIAAEFAGPADDVIDVEVVSDSAQRTFATVADAARAGFKRDQLTDRGVDYEGDRWLAS